MPKAINYHWTRKNDGTKVIICHEPGKHFGLVAIAYGGTNNYETGLMHGEIFFRKTFSIPNDWFQKEIFLITQEQYNVLDEYMRNKHVFILEMKD